MSRFVPAGTDPNSQTADDGWSKAQQKVEAQRQSKPLDHGQQEGGKSLYEVLQQNKAAKQEAFEEAAKLKNQFRALDEDEVDFLDSVLESTRAKEDAVKQETAEQIDAFRRQRVIAEQSLLGLENDDSLKQGDSVAVASEVWSTKKKKRRRDQDRSAETNITGTKLRKLSSTEAPLVAGGGHLSSVSMKLSTSLEKDTSPAKKTTQPIQEMASVKHSKDPSYSPPGISAQASATSTALGLGLGGYSSEDDD